jgi:peptidoglycan/xylan/chitin deacetylase (PgdA/CDA1 family)
VPLSDKALKGVFALIMMLVTGAACRMAAGTAIPPCAPEWTCDKGGILRADSADRRLAWVFTGDEYFEGIDRIADILSKKDVKGSFFLTGRLFRNPLARGAILRLKADGHYLGPHSDQHLLYNDWTRRDSVLVSRDSMQRDLRANYAAMEALGIRMKRSLFIPPFEWWNDKVAGWCREMGVQIVNFTPGTGTNADYTFPEMGAAYRSSDTLLQRLLRFEHLRGLGGALVLVHIGTDPRRTDKFYDRLPMLIDTLRERGYRFERVDRLLRRPRG